MNRYLQSVLVAAVGAASMTYALAQDVPSPPTAPDPSETQTSPPSSTEPSTTPSPSRQAAAGNKETHKQMMKDCVANERANDTGLSKSQAKKNCKAQMKSNSAQPKSY